MKIRPPKKFLCKFPLEQGAYIAAVVNAFVTLSVLIAMLVQVVEMGASWLKDLYPWKYGFCFSIIGCVFCFAMLLVHLALVWAVHGKVQSLVDGWILLEVVWLVLFCCVLLVVVFTFTRAVHFTQLMCVLNFGLFGIILLLYLLYVVYGYSHELSSAAP